MDQFFECLDEIRSSQSALGSSGVWNSVFSAITAASSLASGSLPIPCGVYALALLCYALACVFELKILLYFLICVITHFA